MMYTAISNTFERALKVLKWMAHPVFVFISLQIVWLAITLLWVYWFVDSVAEITKLASENGTQYFDNQYAFAMLIAGCILLGVLLVGTVVLFISGQRQSHLIQQQKNFVSSVTHELRSPLASLQIAIETLNSRELEADTRSKILNMANHDLDRLSRLVNQILVSSRLDRGIKGLSEESSIIKLDEMLESHCQRLHWLTQESEIKINISCPKGLKIKAPSSIVSLILSNIIENAIKFSPKNSLIEILAEPHNNMVSLSFKDEGIGLEKHEKTKIFRMFHRSMRASQKAIPGTGLGLFLVKTLSRLLGGKVWVVSDGIDKGCTFFVNLPINLPN